ncbi:MAG: hypothetical protein EHM45_05950 [Desulfobacteraceae bacterium]|nr:MAG: hypothetical protein EHM45_05950 [Desulfobacteraceae bacterium]
MKKNPASKNFLLKTVFIFFISVGVLFWIPSVLLAQDPAPEEATPAEEPAAAPTVATIIRLIHPAEGALVIGKKPEIRFALLDAGSVKGITAILDGTDITNVMKQEGAEFSFKPIAALASGQHTLQITVVSQDGQELVQEAAFSSRHTERFEEATSDNEIGLVYKHRVAKSDYIHTEVKNRFDATLSSNSKLKDGGFETSFTTNAHYADQNLPIAEPERKGVNLSNFLWQTKYTKDKFSTGSDVGDLQLNETPLTVAGLARRGGQLAFGYDNYEVHGFVVRSKELSGFNGGFGIEGPSNEHILGTGASAKFFQEKMLLKGTYIAGGEKENSFGTWGDVNQRRGRAAGGSMQLKLFDDKLIFDSEYAETNYDGDTSDIYDAEEDEAYNYGLSWIYNILSLKGSYQYIGPKYAVIGNASTQNDYEGVNLEGTASFKTQTLTLGYSDCNDNVKENELVPQVTTTAAKAGYTFNGIENLTLGLNYDRSKQESALEPAGTDPIKVYTTNYSGSINYIVWKLNLGFTAGHSVQDDRMPTDQDTETDTYTFTPALTLDALTVTPSYSYNSTWDKSTLVTTDTHTTGLNFNGHFFENRLLYDFAGTHNRTETSDRLTDNYTLGLTYKLTYVLAEKFGVFTKPSISIDGRYGSTHDYIANTRTHEKVVFLVFSSILPFSF